MQFIAAASVWFFGISLAHADGDRLRRVEFAKHRPANFYEIVYSENATICGPLLKSLNREHVQSTPADSTAIFHNRFLVNAWKHGKYEFKIRIGDQEKVAEGWWQVAVLDLNQDGNDDGVFRRTGSLSSWMVHYLFVESPTKPDVISGRKLTLQRRAEIMGIIDQDSAIRLNEVKLSPQWTKPNFPTYIDDTWPAYFDIIKIRGRHYILTTNAFYWTTKSYPRSLKVTVIEYKKSREFKIKCQFKGKKKIYLE